MAREAARKDAARQNETTVEERQRRVESRRAFSGMSSREALQLAIDRHPEFTLIPAWRAPALREGQRIAGYESDFVARVAERGGGGGHLVVSSVPMRAVNREGLKQPVDLSLDRVSGGFRPVNPLADVRLGERLDDGLAAPGVGLTMRPVGAGGHAPPLLSGDALFYGEAFTDTDVIVRPTVDGFSLSLQVRSAASPERFVFDLAVAEGFVLEAAPERNMLEIWRGGELQGIVTAPVAWDADRRPVALSWQLDGSRLVVDVPHRDRDLAYPLLVDPDVVETFEWERYGMDGQYGNIAGWTYGWNGNFQNLSWAGNSTWLGNGLYIRNLQWGMGSSALYFHAGNAGWWTFGAPGLARLNRVEWNLFDQDYVDGTCTELGINGPGGWRSGNPSWSHCGIYYNQYANSWGSGEPGDNATFKVQAVTSGHKPYFAAQVGVVYLYMNDPDVPSIGSELPAGWVNWPTERELDAWAVDPSTGVSELRLSAAGWAGVTIGPETYTRCPRTYVCPRAAVTGGASARLGTMPQGVNDIAVSATDPAGNQPTAATAPTVSGQGLRAELYDTTSFTTLKQTRLDAQVDFNWGTGAPSAAVGADNFTVRWSGYVEAPEAGTYTFQTSADDGVRLYVNDLNTPIIDDWRQHAEEARTGTVSLQAGRRYRIVLEYFEAGGGAVARLRWRLPTALPGAEPVTIPSSRLAPPGGWKLKLDRGAPTFDEPSGELWNKRGQALNGPSSVRVTARDGNPAGPNSLRRSGVRRMEVYLSYPGEPVPGLLIGSKDQPADCPVDPAQPSGPRSTDSCLMTYDYTFPANDASYPDGRYTITFKAFDYASNPAGETSWSFIKDSLPPQILEVTHNPAVTDQWVGSKAMSVKVKAADAGTGVKGMTLTKPTPSGPVETTQENSCLGTIASICPNPDEKTFNYNTSELAEGYVDPFLRAFDSARRHSSPASWRLKVDRSGPVLSTPSGVLWNRRNQPTDHRLEGLYDRYYSVDLSATDGANTNNATRRSGVKAINVRVLNSSGGVAVNSPDPNPQGCANDSCPKSRTFTFDTDSVPADGDYTIEVTAVDQVGNPSGAKTWSVTVDRRGDIYRAQEVTDDPGAGGEVIATERHKLGTTLARREEEELVTTRRVVSCQADPQALCGETRELSLEDDANTGRQYLLITRGTSQSDSRLDDVAAIRKLGSERLGTPATQGPIIDALRTWQTPPPAHGANYERHDRVEQVDVDGQQTTVTRQLYIDAGTRLPLRERVTVGSDVERDFFYTYGKVRLTDSEVPANEFAVDRTADGDTETQQLPASDSEQNDTAETSVSSAAARGFRQETALSTDPTWIAQSLTDVTAQPAISAYGVPLFPAERLEMDERNLAAEAIETHIAPYVATNATGTYAGAWLDNKAGGLIRVGFTSNAETHLAPLQALFPYANRLRVFTADATVAELDALVSEIDSDFAELDTLGIQISSVAPSIPENAVRVGIDEPNLVMEQVLRARYGPNVVVARDAGPAEFQSRRETLGIPPVYGGLKIFTTRDGPTRERCTSGFSVRLGEKRRILTAAHCTKMHEEWRHTSGSKHERIGTVTADVDRYDDDFNRRGNGADVAQIRVKRVYVTRRIFDHPRARDSFTIMRRQASENANPVGETICVLGWVHTPPRCGEFMSQKATWRVGLAVYRNIGQWKSYEEQKPFFGTSGGPTYRAPPAGGGTDNGGTAYGVHMGCECNFEEEGQRGRGLAYFTPMATVTELFGTRLVGP